MAVPCKVRNFVWRACRNAIPTNLNLVRHCVIEDSTCSFCTQSPEYVLHSLWSCPSLTQVWEDDPQWAFGRTTRFQSFPQVLLHVLEWGCSGDLFTMLTWNIWFRRNKVRTSPLGWSLDQLAQQAYQCLQEFRSTQPRKPIAATPA
ncbi:hypothetical protein SO802_006596 [Lithocarpus litseifolius]|uniref:Reverse transcriptase zinc-binding domain-containing protein n=1 Tax=Lithocarpus litseifolius TaxID=425828 RepID=A0AAW2DPF4_9ROSI